MAAKFGILVDADHIPSFLRHTVKINIKYHINHITMLIVVHVLLLSCVCF